MSQNTDYWNVDNRTVTHMQHNNMPWCELDGEHQAAILTAVPDVNHRVWRHSGIEWVQEKCHFGSGLDLPHKAKTIFRVMENCFMPSGDPHTRTKMMYDPAHPDHPDNQSAAVLDEDEHNRSRCDSLNALALRKWGQQQQMLVAVAELAELITAVSDWDRGRPDSHMNLIGELADAQIVMREIMMIAEVSDFELSQEVTNKLDKFERQVKCE